MTQKNNSTFEQQFAEWYATVDFDRNPDRIQKRLKGMTGLISSMKRAEQETLLRLVVGQKNIVQPDKLSWVAKIFSDLDDDFDEDNHRELQILAGSALLLSLLRGGRDGAFTGFSLLTTEFDGGRTFQFPAPLRAFALSNLEKSAERLRQRPNLASIATPKVDLTLAKAKVADQAITDDDAKLQASFDELTKAFQKVVDAVSLSINKVLKATREYEDAQDEELQVLWWLTSAYSHERKRAFSKLKQEEKTLILPYELSEKIEVLPFYPDAILNILERAGLKRDKKMTIPSLVNGCELDWLKSLDAQSYPLSAPIHYAIQRRLETADDESWIAGWSAVTGLDKDKVLSQLDLGNMFFYESLLAEMD